MDDVKLFRKGNVYKIAWFSNRRDAKRHLYKPFQAISDGEAIETFVDVVTTLRLQEENRNKTFKLYSGDWKREIYSFEE